MSKLDDLGLIPEEEPVADPHGLGLQPDEPTVKERAIQGARVAGKVLDYPRGAGAVQLDKIAQMLGRPAAISPEQAARALSTSSTTTAPSYREMLAKYGVPPGPATSDIPPRAGLAGVVARHLPNVSARDVAGTAMDVGLDPMTYAGGALGRVASLAEKVPLLGSTAERLAQVLGKPVSAPGKAAATGIYESGVRPIIQAGERYGNPNVGKTMLAEGIRGAPPAIEQGMEQAATKFKAMRDAQLAAGEAAGAMASKDAALTPMFEQLQGMIADQRLTPNQASRILIDVTKPKMRGGDLGSPSLMTRWKTDIGDALPGSTWDELSKSTPTLANRVKETTQQGYRQEVEAALNRATPGAGDELATTNRKLGDMINTDVKRAASTMATGYEKKPILSTQDLLFGLAGMGGAGMIHQGHTLEAGAAMVGLKKLIEAARSPGVKTTLGVAGDRLLNAPVVSPLLDSAARRATVDLSRKSPYVVPAKSKE